MDPSSESQPVPVPETCEECGFDSRAWRERDAGSLFEDLGMWWTVALGGIGGDELLRRPGDAVWSVLEYGLHIAVVTALHRAGIELILAGRPLPSFDVPRGADGTEALDLDPSDVGQMIEREGTALHRLTRDAAKGGVGPSPWPPGAVALLLHATHDASHHLQDVSRQLARLRPRPGAGRLEQINISRGGVPKRPVERATVTRSGVEGDKQADRKHHGRPFQAVCLWSTEVIGALASDGHPLFAGAAGENFTVSGLDWSSLRPGTTLGLGDELVVELSWPATPCRHQAQWFTDGDYLRIDHGRDPGAVRWYGWVRRPGQVEAGMAVTVV